MRYLEIDLIKGIAVILMVIFHFFYFSHFLNVKKYNISSYPLSTIAQIAHTLFILFMGINLSISYNKNKKDKKKYRKKILNKCVIYFLVALYMSFFSYKIFGRESCVKLGIFHFMFFATIIASFYPGNNNLNLITIFIIILLKFLVNNNKFENINKYFGFITGLNCKFGTLDYFPLIPWLALVLLGILIGNNVYKDKKENNKINNIIENNVILNNISKIGSKSLEIYIIHWPIIYLLIK